VSSRAHAGSNGAGPGVPKWHRRPGQRRREILDAAQWAFGRSGYQRATLADVAERAGVCPATVSHYFGSKAELFEALIADRFGGLVAQEESFAAAYEGPMRTLLRELLRRIWDHAWAPGIPALMQVVQVEAAEFPDSGLLLCRQLSERWRRLFGRIIEAGIRSGEFRALEPDVTARAIVYSLLGVAQKVASFARFDPEMPDRETLWRAVIQMVEGYVLREGVERE
jgi:AcrR family transcriptional regulator